MEHRHGRSRQDLLWRQQQSLCLHAAGRDTDSYAYCYRYCDTDCDSDRNAYIDCYADCDCNAHCYFNCKSHCNSYCDCHGDFHSHFHANYNYDSTTNSNSYAYGYSDDYAQANAYAQAAWNAEGTTHPAAPPDRAARINLVGRDRSPRRSPSTAKAGRRAEANCARPAEMQRKALTVFCGKIAGVMS